MSIRSRISNWFVPETIEQKDDFEGSFQLVQTAPYRTSRDIQKFLTALKAAEGRNVQERTVLYDIYGENMDYDSHLSGLIERRIENIVQKDIRFMINDVENEDMKEWLEAPKFRQFLADVMMVRFWGMGLFEFKKANDGWFDYYKIPIKHINPYKMEVLKRQNDSQGIPILKRIGKDMVFVGNKDSFGYMKTLTPLCIHKRNLMNYWSTYSELAGNNFMTVNYRNIDPKRRNELEAAIAAVKAGKVFQKPDGMDLEVTNMSSSSQNALFENYFKQLNEEQSKYVLGQTMTTSDGSSRSQAEVHERTQGSVFASDEKYILDFLNYTFYDFLKLWGKPEGRFTVYETQGSGLVTSLGVGGLQALKDILVERNLTKEQKVAMLTIVFGIEEGAADIMTQGKEIEEEPEEDDNDNGQQDEVPDQD